MNSSACRTRAWWFLTCALASFAAASADITYISQSRSVYAVASDIGAGASGNSDGKAATDFGPFDATVSAQTTTGCSASASQSSRLFARAITFSGSASATDTDCQNTGSGASSGTSTVDITFSVSAPTAYQMAFTVTGNYLGAAGTLTNSSGDRIFMGSPANNTFTSSGTLPPDTYHFVATVPASMPGFGCGSTAATFTGSLEVPPCAPIGFASMPAPQAGCRGGVATLTASADNVSFQWLRVNKPLTDGPTASGSILSGSTTNTLVITGFQPADADTYACAITNSCGDTLTSPQVPLQVADSPKINSQPLSQPVCLGGFATFTTGAIVEPLQTFTWQSNGVPLSDGPTPTGAVLSGTSTPTLSITGAQVADATDFTCVVTNACGAVTSNVAALAVNTGAPTLSTQPESFITCPSAVATVSVRSSSGLLLYKWQWLPENSPSLLDVVNGLNYNPVTHLAEFIALNSTSSDLSLRASANLKQNGKSFGLVCTASNGCSSVVSDFASVTVCAADFDCSGSVGVGDITAFLSAWFARSPSADFNADGTIGIQDIFDFLAAWFAGC